MKRVLILIAFQACFLLGQTRVELSKQVKGSLPADKGGTGVTSCGENEGLLWQSGTFLCSPLANVPHAASHQHGGTDEVATGAPGDNAIPKAGATGTLADGWIPPSVSRDTENPAAGDISGSFSAGYTINPNGVQATQVDLTDTYAWTGTHTLTDFQDKGSQVFNVKAYGAVGDGVADDTASIQAAHDAAAAEHPAIVFFPSGTYLVTATLSIANADNITWAGANATLKAKSDTNLRELIRINNGSTNIAFHSLTFDGNYINQTSDLGRGIVAAGAYRLVIRNSIIRNFARDQTTFQSFGVFCFNTPQCHITSSLFYNNGQADIRIDNAEGSTRDFLVDDTDLTNSESDGCIITNNQFGIAEFNEWDTTTDWNRKNAAHNSIEVLNTRNCVISNNSWPAGANRRRATPKNRGHALLCFTCWSTTVSGNTVWNLANGVGSMSVTQGSNNITGTGTDFSNEAGVLTDINSYVLIEGDATVYRITGVSSESSIAVSPPVARVSGSNLRYKINYGGDLITVTHGESNTITGNTTSFSHDNGFGFGNGDLNTNDFQYNIVQGNIAKFTYTSGFLLSGDGFFNTFVGNVAVSNGQGGAELNNGLRSGIHFRANVQNNVVVGNLLADTQPGGTQLYGIRESPTGIQQDNVYEGNHYVGNLTEGLNLAGPSLVRDSQPFTQATLPVSLDGSLVYCSDCNKDATCTAGGSGAVAKREGGSWDCD